MQPVCAQPTQLQADPLKGVELQRRVFSDLSAREIRIVRELEASGNSHQIYKFLCDSRDAEEAVDLSGCLNKSFDERRFVEWGFYCDEVLYWQSYWRKVS